MSQEFIQITEADLEDRVALSNRLNFIFSHLMDRIDQLEGTRGTATVQLPLEINDSDGNRIHGFIS